MFTYVEEDNRGARSRRRNRNQRIPQGDVAHNEGAPAITNRFLLFSLVAILFLATTLFALRQQVLQPATFTDKVRQEFNRAEHSLESAAESVLDRTKDAFRDGKEAVQEKFDSAKNSADSIRNDITSQLHTSVLGRKTHAALHNAEQVAKEWGEDVSHSVRGVTHAVEDKLHQAKDTLHNLGDRIHLVDDRLRSDASANIHRAEDAIGNAAHSIKDKVHDVGDRAHYLKDDIKEAAQEKLHTVEFAAQKAKFKAQNAFDRVELASEEMLHEIKRAAGVSTDSFMEKITSATPITNAIHNAEHLVHKAKDTMQDAAHKLQDTFDDQTVEAERRAQKLDRIKIQQHHTHVNEPNASIFTLIRNGAANAWRSVFGQAK